jgi:alpha-L-rhamnosidase
MANDFSLVAPVELKCEYKTNPTGIDEKHPRFSWLTKYEVCNSFQTAYRIIIALSIQSLIFKEVDIWDSGKVPSPESTLIKFTGNPLHSNKTYYWQVMIWSEKNEASSWSKPAEFSTGLFGQGEWKAEWISHIYNEEPKKSIGFQSGIDKWIWYPFNSFSDKFQSIVLLKTFELDRTSEIDSANLIVTADEKFKLYLNEKLIAESDDKIFSWARPVSIEIRELLNERRNQFRALGLNSYVENPGFMLRFEIKYKSGKTIVINTDETWTASIETNEKDLINAGVVAFAGDKPWRLPQSELSLNPAAYFRKSFSTTKRISRAFVYCSALGLYNLQINGKQVSEDRLTPGWSDFHNRVNDNSYDVTSILNLSSEHIINLILADGYYSGYCGWEKGRGYYGKFPAVKIQLMISYDDGTDEIICTDENWVSSEGPIREADILMGEFYDSNYESNIKGWDSYNFDESNFKKVNVTADINPELISYKAEPVRQRFEFKPQSITRSGDKKFIIDFGQNFTGFARLVLRNVGKQKIILSFAEMLNEDGTLYTENIRMARAHDTYISKGDSEEVWEPLFTYHGFRYVEISGLEKIDDQTVLGISINSLPEQTAAFTSSDPRLNKLFDCILWNQKSNYLDIPTDCPQRDERFGWTSDAVSYFPTAAFNFDVSSFYQNWFENLFEAQRIDGALPPFAPLADMGVGPVYFNSAGWADAGIITPYLFYKFYKDKNLLEKYYERMKIFIKSLEIQSSELILPEYGYGDWLCIGEATSKSFIATAYFAYDCSVMKKIASILGYSNDELYYDELFQKIKQSFRNKFLNADGSLIQLTQTSTVLSIHFELLDADEAEKVISFLIEDITEKNYHITTGFLGLSFLMQVLSSMERNDIAWKVLTNNEFPGWLFMIDNGATTLWERWDSFHPEKGFYDPTMNSFNHCSLGCVGEWFFTGIAGINAIEPGFRKFMIKPFIHEELTYAEASFKTIYGVIKSEWKKDKENLIMKIQVPFNTTAVIVIPFNVYELSKTHSILRKENNCTYIEVGSGSYEITGKLE